MEHLKRSFTEGDNHYEAQFWFARELSCREISTKRKSCSARLLNERRADLYRSAALVEANRALAVFEGTMARKEEGYGFVKLARFPERIFASRAESRQSDWEALKNGVDIECHVGFTRRGPRATEVRSQTARPR